MNALAQAFHDAALAMKQHNKAAVITLEVKRVRAGACR
jgi:hypothetical protein